MVSLEIVWSMRKNIVKTLFHVRFFVTIKEKFLYMKIFNIIKKKKLPKEKNVIEKLRLSFLLLQKYYEKTLYMKIFIIS